MHENPFEKRSGQEKELRDELEQLHREILDTRAQIAQVKEDAVQDPRRAGELVNLKTILDALDLKRQLAEHQLADLTDQSGS